MKLAKLIFATGIIALLGAGCGKAPAGPSNVNQPPAVGSSRAVPASEKFTVRILPNGEFDPVTSFVKKGAVVTFQNDAEKNHSIVPQEDGGKKFSSLDSQGKIAPGASFSVTMDQAGRWLFSDGTNPAFGGAIEVIE